MSITKAKKCRLFPQHSSPLWERFLWLSWEFLRGPGPLPSHLLLDGAGQADWRPSLATAADGLELIHQCLHHFHWKNILKYWARFSYWFFKRKNDHKKVIAWKISKEQQDLEEINKYNLLLAHNLLLLVTLYALGCRLFWFASVQRGTNWGLYRLEGRVSFFVCVF